MRGVRSALVLAAVLLSLGAIAGWLPGAGSAVTADCPELGSRVDGTAGRDNLRAAADSVGGGAGSDRLRGGGGNDQLDDGAGADVLSGDTGADSLKGGTGRDTLVGGGGSDFLGSVDGERDRVACGSGRDTAIVDERIASRVTASSYGSCLASAQPLLSAA